MRRPNWHHFDRVLCVLGYKVVMQQTRGYIYYTHPAMKKVILEKSNAYPEEQVHEYLRVMGGLPRPFFESIYKKCARR